MISCRGWPKKLNLWVGLGMFFATLTSSAGSLTVRDIQAKGNQIEIQLDGLLPRNSIEVDYVRDIVQFSVQNATIYPAKIIHAESQSFSKVFAYQYSPNLVRIRLSVEGAADRFHGKVKWTQKGKSVVIDFPENAPKSAEIQEKS